MDWMLILPAIATVTAVVALALGLRPLEREAVRLRSSLRRSVATAVATDELGREASRVRARAELVRRDGSRRLSARPRRWSSGAESGSVEFPHG